MKTDEKADAIDPLNEIVDAGANHQCGELAKTKIDAFGAPAVGAGPRPACPLQQATPGSGARVIVDRPA